MTMATTESLASPPPRRKLTRRDLNFLIDAGAFRPEERLELIEGEMIEKMPQKAPHTTSVSLAEDELRRAFPMGHFVRVQLPLAVSDYSQPDPDVAVVEGSIRDYEDDHPATAVLVVEVADTSLNYDRNVKAGLYASAQVPEYWIVNLNDRLLEVHRQPAKLSAAPGGHHYLSIERYGDAQIVVPLLAPDAAIRVADLLPSRKDLEAVPSR